MVVTTRLHKEAEDLLREAIAIIEGERDILVRSFRVTLRADPDFGQIVDKRARAEVRRMDSWLRQARAVLK